MDYSLIILLIIFSYFPVYHYGKIIYYKCHKCQKVIENAIIVEEPYVKKLALGKICRGVLSPVSSDGKTFSITTPNLTKNHKGDTVPIVYYGSEFKGLCLLSERKSDDRLSIALLSFVVFLIFLSLLPS